MKTYKVTFDHTVYKPSNYFLVDKERKWEVHIEAEDLASAKNILRSEHNKNPFYFKFEEL